MPEVMITLEDVVSGVWTFSKDVDPHTLARFAYELKTGPEGNRFLDVHVRPSSNGQHCLGFQFRWSYAYRDSKHFFHKMKAQLVKRFGKKNLKGWDIGHHTWLIY